MAKLYIAIFFVFTINIDTYSKIVNYHNFPRYSICSFSSCRSNWKRGRNEHPCLHHIILFRYQNILKWQIYFPPAIILMVSFIFITSVKRRFKKSTQNASYFHFLNKTILSDNCFFSQSFTGPSTARSLDGNAITVRLGSVHVCVKPVNIAQ